jgi:hypothetical protein
MLFCVLLRGIAGLKVLADEDNFCNDLINAGGAVSNAFDLQQGRTAFILTTCSLDSVSVNMQQYLDFGSNIGYAFIDHYTFHTFSIQAYVIMVNSQEAALYVRHSSFTNLTGAGVVIGSYGFAFCEIIDVITNVSRGEITAFSLPGQNSQITIMDCQLSGHIAGNGKKIADLGGVSVVFHRNIVTNCSGPHILGVNVGKRTEISESRFVDCRWAGANAGILDASNTERVPLVSPRRPRYSA